MTVQLNWLTDLETFDQFKFAAMSDPERVFLSGATNSFPNALSFAAIAEEREFFRVSGPGFWVAHISRRSRLDLTEEYANREYSSRKRRKNPVRRLNIIKAR